MEAALFFEMLEETCHFTGW